MSTMGAHGLDPMTAAALAAGAYLAGSVNFSLIAARILGHGDLRAHGSKNAGATNLARVAGKGVAFAVLALDVGRGAGIVLLGSALGLGPFSLAAGLALILGNVFPAFHGFRGGKGVAAAVGSVLAVSPLAMLSAGALFLAVFAVSRRVSAGSIAMAAGYPLALSAVLGPGVEALVGAVIAAVLLATHKKNIARLFSGQEPKFTFGRRDRERRDP